MKTGFTLLFFLLLFNSAFSQFKKQNDNFYKVREEILKKIAQDEKEGTFNEEERESDDIMAKFKRWEHFVDQRVYPTGDFFDPEAVIKEYRKYYKNHQQKNFTPANNWLAVGPFYPVTDAAQTGIGGIGRINCLAQHPVDSNILYIGTFGGGIWKTIDGGLNWTSLDENLPAMSVSDIAINPLHPDTIYVATGDAVGNFFANIYPDPYHQGHYSAGIIMSSDGGQTWSQTGFTYQQYQIENIYRLVIDPVNTNNLLAGTLDGMYRSTDAGVSWIKKDSTKTYDIQYNPLDPSKYYATTNGGVKLRRSFDGGDTWITTNAANLIGGVGLSRISISPADTGKIYIMRGTGRLHRSTNGGGLFITVSYPGNTFGHQGSYDKAFAISPVDTNIMILGLVDLYKSVNQGFNFTAVDSIDDVVTGIHVDFHSMQFANGNSNKLYATSDGGVYVSYDIGETWTSLNNGINVTQYYKMSSSNLNPEHILAGAQDNSTHFYDGLGWTVVTCCDGMDPGFDKTNEQIAYATTQNGNFMRSLDSGRSFSVPITPPGLNGNWESPHFINPVNASTIYFGGTKVYISYNRGDNWSDFSTVLDNVTKITSMAQSSADTNVFYAASFQKFFVTADYGLTWINRTAGLPADSAAITDVKVDETNSQIVYVTFSGFKEGKKIFKTIDGGLNWTNISGTLPNVPFNTIIIQKNANGDLYAGCDFGVFYYDPNVGDWSAFNTDLPGVVVSDLDLNYRSGILYVATQGRGIYKAEPVNPVAPILNDAAIAEIIQPVVRDYCDSVTTPLVIKIKNYGSDTLFSVSVNYSIDNGPVNTITFNDSLPSFNSVVDTLATFTSYWGQHNIRANTSNPNGNADDYPLNDTKDISFKVSNAIAQYPFIEDFENANFPPAEWFTNPGSFWYEDSVHGAFGTSTHSAEANFYDVIKGTAELTSLRVDLSNATAVTSLGFAHAYARYSATYIDTLAISISNDCGVTWNIIYAKSDTALSTVAAFVTSPYVPTASQWIWEYIDISPYINQLIKVKFEARSGYGNNLFVDNINIFHGTIAIEENNFNSLQVYPNPSDGLIYIVDPGRIINNVKIFDLQGRLIKRLENKEVHDAIDLRNYAEQVYFVRMQTTNGFVTKKLVVIR